MRVLKSKLPALVVIEPTHFAVNKDAYFVTKTCAGCMVFESNIGVIEIMDKSINI
jgi:hypothetical protein